MFKFIFLLLFFGKLKCELTVIYQESQETQNVSCLTSGKHGLALDVTSDPYSDNEAIDNVQNYFLVNLSNLKSWREASSLHSDSHFFNAITDSRWNSFRYHKVFWNETPKKIFSDYVLPKTAVNISISVKLYDNNTTWLEIGNLYNISLVQNDINLNDSDCTLETNGRWLHFTIYIAAKKISIPDANCMFETYRDFDLDFLVFGGTSVWKIHDYKYQFTNKIGKSVLSNLKTGFDCISMYLAMCELCEIEVQILENGEVIKDEVVNNSTSWKYYQICDNQLKNPNISLVIETISNKTNGNFWAIDEVSQSLNDNINYITMRHTTDENFPSCENIYTHDIAWKTDPNDIDKNCFINDINRFCYNKECTVCCKKHFNNFCYLHQPGVQNLNVTIDKNDTVPEIISNGNNSDGEKDSFKPTDPTISTNETNIDANTDKNNTDSAITQSTITVNSTNTTTSTVIAVTSTSTQPTSGNPVNATEAPPPLKGSFNYNYLYFLLILLVIPIIIVILIIYKKKSLPKATPVRFNQYSEVRQTPAVDPSWIFKRPDDEDDSETENDRLSIK